MSAAATPEAGAQAAGSPGEASAPPSPAAAPLSPQPPPPPPEVEEAQRRLVKALHGTLLQSHINAPRSQANAVDALLTMVQNVLREPRNDKFRRVRVGNEAFKARVVAVRGGEDFLRAAGWRDATITFERHLVHADAPHSEEVLRVAERLLQKVQTTVTEKAERHEREVWAAKNADRLAREATIAALSADKEARREAAARAAAAQGKPPPESKLA